MTNKLSLWFFSLAALFGSGAGWFCAFSFLKGQRFSWASLLGYFLIFLIAIFWVIFLSFRFALFISVLSFLPILIISFGLISSIALILAIIFFAAGAQKTKRHLKNSVKIKVSATLLVSYSLITTSLFLAGSGLYFSELTKKHENKHLPPLRLALTQKTTDFILKKTKSFSQLGVIGYDSSLSLEQAISKSLKEESSQEPSALEVNKYLATLEKSWKMELDPQLKISEIFNQIINQKIEDYLNSLEKTNPLSAFGLALGLFLTLKTVAFLFELPFFLLMEIIFWLGRLVGLFKINKKEVTKETLA
jgi:hypothetical protein